MKKLPKPDQADTPEEFYRENRKERGLRLATPKRRKRRKPKFEPKPKPKPKFELRPRNSFWFK